MCDPVDLVLLLISRCGSRYDRFHPIAVINICLSMSSVTIFCAFKKSWLARRPNKRSVQPTLAADLEGESGSFQVTTCVSVVRKNWFASTRLWVCCKTNIGITALLWSTGCENHRVGLVARVVANLHSSSATCGKLGPLADADFAARQNYHQTTSRLHLCGRSELRSMLVLHRLSWLGSCQRQLRSTSEPHRHVHSDMRPTMVMNRCLSSPDSCRHQLQ